MELRQLIADEDAVSPVIGVILMVAITVILAAVIGTFVLGLGDQVSNTSPQASLTFDFESDGTAGCGSGGDGTLTVTHDGGDSIMSDQLSLTGSTPAGTQVWTSCAGLGSNTDISAGDSVDIQSNSDDIVRIVWEASGGGDTSTIGKWTGPDA